MKVLSLDYTVFSLINKTSLAFSLPFPSINVFLAFVLFSVISQSCNLVVLSLQSHCSSLGQLTNYVTLQGRLGMIRDEI